MTSARDPSLPFTQASHDAGREAGDQYGRLERRVRTVTGDCEIHLLRFDFPDGLDRLRADPRRGEALSAFERSAAKVELVDVVDVVSPGDRPAGALPGASRRV